MFVFTIYLKSGSLKQRTIKGGMVEKRLRITVVKALLAFCLGSPIATLPHV